MQSDMLPMQPPIRRFGTLCSLPCFQRALIGLAAFNFKSLFMNKKLLERIQELFFEALTTKTGWGRNDIKEVYKDCVIQALSEQVDNHEAILKSLDITKA